MHHVRTLALVLGIFTIASFTGCEANQRTGRNAPPPDQLVVLSYNIHHGRGLDDVVGLERIADVIRETGADVVALQEVDNGTQRTDGVDQAAVLAELLDMEHVFGRALDYQGGEYGNAILSRYPITGTRNVPLANIEEGEDRVALAADIRLPSGRTFTLISTHLDHRSDPNRITQITTINRTLAAGDAPALLVGDINAQPGSPELRLLAERWTRVDEADPGPTLPADEPSIRIDFVHARPADRWEPIDATVIDEPLASDHRPLRATLQLR